MAILQGQKLSDEMSLDEIQMRVVKAYGSLSEPRFDFVNNTVRNNPYKEVVKLLQECGEVLETTDPNDDVSFSYVCRLSDNHNYYVSLSMVGPYALVYDDDLEPITEAKNNSFLERLLSTLNRKEIVLLGKDMLQKRIPLLLDNAENENVSLYRALFSDSDI